MEKLVKRLEDTLDESIPNWDTIDWEKHNKLCAEEARKIAIQFAKSLMDSEISTHRSGKIGEIDKEVTKYIPPEYSLIKGELIMNGDNLFNNFIDNYYEKTKS